MKLLRCHIENFGKLTDYTVDFTENPQVFYAPNGWGKSTLAAFIKVMFYGFANEKKRGDTLERERLRYKPWQGGVYGGELEFEAEGKRYVMNRTFGSKDAEDTFVLYDGVTNLKSNDFTTAIGEELFQINQESFLRTVYLAQNDCDTATTDSINAKIGNLADNLDDINNYEKVQQVLKDLRNSMSPTRKTGSLKKKKEEIAQLRDELRKAGVMESAVTELEEKKAECSEEMTKLVAERKAVREAWEVMTRRKAVEAKKSHYDRIVSQFQDKQNQVSANLAAMGGSVPDQGVFSHMQEQYRLLQEKESEALANTLQESEVAELIRLRDRFANGVPKADALKECREKLNRLENLRLEAARKALDENEVLDKKRLEEQFFGQDIPSENVGKRLEVLADRLDESLRCVSAYIDQKNGLSAKKATLGSLKLLEQQQNAQRQQLQQQRMEELKNKQKVQRKAQNASVAVLIAGIALLVAGGILLALANQVVGITLLGAGAVAVVLSGVMIAAGRKSRIDLQSEVQAQDAVETDDSVGVLEQEIVLDEAQMLKNREFVAAVLADVNGEEFSDWSTDYAWEDPLRLRDQLYGWKDGIRSLQRLKAKELDYQAKGYETEIRNLQEEIVGQIKPYCGQFEESRMSELLVALSEDRERFVTLDVRASKCGKAKLEADAHKQQLTAFLAEHGQSTTNLYESLQKLTRISGDYANDCKELDRLKKEKQDFEASNDIAAFAQVAGTMEGSETELKTRMIKLDEAISNLDEQIHGYRRQLEERQEELEELAWQKEQLHLAEADYEKDLVYYTRIGYVSEYLEKAKECLAAKYIGPVLDSFKRNFELLSGESGEDFRMDANIHVTKKAFGEQREAGAFSAGNKDLIHIVLRIALVEAMYRKEKPFLIIDDSFVNLDQEKLETAGQFLKQIAKDYQVIYFTCHESRVLTG